MRLRLTTVVVEYMACYEEYKTEYPEHAATYHKMAMQEKVHAETILEMYPELEEMIERLSKHVSAS